MNSTKKGVSIKKDYQSTLNTTKVSSEIRPFWLAFASLERYGHYRYGIRRLVCEYSVFLEFQFTR